MATKRKLFEEIRTGLEAYRDRPRTLTHREFSAPDVKAVREKFGMSQADMATFLNVSKGGADPRGRRKHYCASWNGNREPCVGRYGTITATCLHSWR